MNVTIPFSKEILFKSNIAEICSISLEHDISINENELLGDFIISGEYKNLDVNVDTNPFSHVVPFSVDLDKDIKLDTLNYEVEDFRYEIINEDTLKVDIKLHVSADKKEEEKVNEDIFIKEEKEERLEDLIEEPTTIEEDKKFIKEESKSIIDIDNLEEDYITYHVHVVKLNETIDVIAKDYNLNKDDILKLNDITSINAGDKLIIPEINNE